MAAIVAGENALLSFTILDSNGDPVPAAEIQAATTNATIVIYDASGQAYRVPCII